jgi:small subunit ribosomal protein S17
MADQPDNNDDVEPPETPAGQDQPAEAPAAPDAAEGPAAEGSDAGAEASGEESSAEQAAEQPADEQPSESAAGTGAGAQPQAAQPGEAPAAQLPPKERRRQTRSTHTGKARPPRSPEERHAERLAVRKDKAARRRGLRLKERAKAASRRSAAGQPASDRAPADGDARAEGTRKVRQGIVVSDKANKSITVRIDVARRHRRYEKIVRSSSTLHAHDENNDAHEGDTVRVIESRPLSRTKRWRLVEVLERAR